MAGGLRMQERLSEHRRHLKNPKEKYKHLTTQNIKVFASQKVMNTQHLGKQSLDSEIRSVIQMPFHMLKSDKPQTGLRGHGFWFWGAGNVADFWGLKGSCASLPVKRPTCELVYHTRETSASIHFYKYSCNQSRAKCNGALPIWVISSIKKKCFIKPMKFTQLTI